MKEERKQLLKQQISASEPCDTNSFERQLIKTNVAMKTSVKKKKKCRPKNSEKKTELLAPTAPSPAIT